ncbi:L,D-transpeptidase family protein [Peptoniphilaceae bacterium SGI.131]
MRNNIRKILSSIFVVSLVFLFSYSSAFANENEEAPVDKWVYREPLSDPTQGKIWMYYNEEGQPEERFYTENGKTWLSNPYYGYKKGWWTDPVSNLSYYFRTETGTMLMGWQYVDDSWRYFSEDGSLVKQKWLWLENNDGSYAWKYFDADGSSKERFYREGDGVWLSTKGPGSGYHKGWWTDPENGQRYFFRLTSGSRVEGWQYIEGAWRYFRLGSATLTTGFQYIDENWYYFRENTGTRVEGFQYINGSWYYFRENTGTRAEGFQYIKGNWYYFRENSGTRAEGWQYINKKWYYFRKGSATRVTGKQYIDGQWYSFAADGSKEEFKYYNTWNVIDGVFRRYDGYGNVYQLRWVGSNHIVINLSTQRMYYYLNGKLHVDTGVVTGMPSRGWATPTGYYAIYSKETNRDLVGADYRLPVEYWMPFYGDYGIHDVYYRTWDEYNYSGTYLYNGSHGCVNTPLDAVRYIYNNAPVGTPVTIID